MEIINRPVQAIFIIIKPLLTKCQIIIEEQLVLNFGDSTTGRQSYAFRNECPSLFRADLVFKWPKTEGEK